MKPSQNKERIAKVLARAGVASRRDVEKMITQGRIKLKGQVVTKPATLISSARDVLVDDKPVPRKERTRLWRYYKPPGRVTTAKDPQGRPTVLDSLPTKMPRVVSIGRLDINTEGLLLLTNDGELARFMEHPKSGFKRTYRVRVHGKVDEEKLKGLKKGITVEGMKYEPITAKLEKVQGSNAWIQMTLMEGKNREVKKVLGALGLKVTRLIRTSYGPLTLGNLNREEVMEVTEGKIEEVWGNK